MFAEQHALRMQARNWSLPEEGNFRGLRPCDHKAVQHCPTHADATAVGETRVHAHVAADKTDPAERM